jgi:hypothetical protein
MRGYQMSRAVVENALKQHPDEWPLVLALAALDHDENNYQREIKADSQYTERRLAAFERFARAAELYSEKASALPEEEQTTQPFDLWFYASLGACDLGQINEETLPEPGQIEIIKTAIHNLPGPAAERHRGMFANGLFTRMSALNPAVKFRYAKYGLEIVGDHKQAQEARKVFDYYNDLVTEIKLEAAVDGSDVVSPQEPFGLFINLRHTREIERESGGFARYLQNQQNMMFAYNYGRPMANYRDKFEEAARKALEEHFEVLSVTFREPTVNSRATDEYGWRVTPYAYVLLKPRGPEVDKIPPLRLDLDFLDTSGYVILPIESNAVAIDASAAKPQARPYSKLTITQILDERQAAEGKLILEVKATAQGLVPPLEEILDVSPADFEVASTEDQGVAVSRFDPESEENVILSERTWAISMQAKNQQTERPREFRFAAPTVDVHEVVYNRYVDADLVAVDQQVLLEQKYGKTDTAWVWPALGGGVVILAAIVFWWRRPRRARAPSESRFQIPEELNAFTVLGLLNQIRTNNGLNDESRRELAASIARVERSYFANEPAEAPDLRQLAESWVQRAK